MIRARRALTALVVIVASARSSSAQEAGRVGLTMAFPASVGIIWQATDALALRPDFTFSQSGGSSLSSGSSTGSVGISALWYVRSWDNLRTYVSPRFSYLRSSISSQGTPSFSPTTSVSGVSGSFGAEYRLHPHFALFAETGIVYSHSHTDGTTSVPGLTFDTATHTWGTRAGVGAIVYF